MFCGILAHAVFLSFSLGVFLHPVHLRIRHDSGDFHGVSNVRAQVQTVTVTLNFPGRPARRRQVEFVCLVALLQAAGHRSHFLMSGLGLRHRRRSYSEQQQGGCCYQCQKSCFHFRLHL